MISEEEIGRRMNILRAKIVHKFDMADILLAKIDHRVDEAGGNGGPITPLSYLIGLDAIIGDWMEKIVADQDFDSHIETIETMLAMSRLYLELYDQLDESDKKSWDETNENTLKWLLKKSQHNQQKASGRQIE